MGTKGTVPITVLVVLLSLGIGGVAGYRVAANRPAAPDRTRALEAEVDRLKAELATAPAPTRDSAAPPEPPEPRTLAALLSKYKSLMEAFEARRQASAAANPGKGYPPEEYGRQLDEIARELSGIRDAIFADPETFLEFLKDPANERYVWDLFDVTLIARRGGNMISQQRYADFPPALMEGLCALLESGSDAVRSNTLEFMMNLTGQPPGMRSQFLRLLGDPGKGVVQAAVGALGRLPDLSREEAAAIARIGTSHADFNVCQSAVLAMAMTASKEGHEWLVAALESGSQPELDANLAWAVGMRLWHGPGEAFEDAALRAFAAAVARSSDETVGLHVLTSATQLPPAKLRSLLESAAARAGTGKARAAAAACLRRLDAGDGRSAVLEVLNEARK